MTAEIYVSMGIILFGALALVVLAVWSKKKETPEFSFLRHIQNMRISTIQYEKFASSTRMMMYLYAFMAGLASAKGNVSMAITCSALFLGFQATLYWVRTKWV